MARRRVWVRRCPMTPSGKLPPSIEESPSRNIHLQTDNAFFILSTFLLKSLLSPAVYSLPYDSWHILSWKTAFSDYISIRAYAYISILQYAQILQHAYSRHLDRKMAVQECLQSVVLSAWYIFSDYIMHISWIEQIFISHAYKKMAIIHRWHSVRNATRWR